MGVSVREILKDKYFKKYSVLAGEAGLEREVQAVALFDAPDGYLWFKGKELVLTTGYLLQDKEYFMEVLKYLHSRQSAAVGIKVDRYLKSIPDEVIQLCDEISMPLIDVPFDEAWIDVINAVNSIAVNRFITKIIDRPEAQGHVSTKYLQKKILHLLGKLSDEIDKSVTIIEAIDKKTITYPQSYKIDQRINCTDQVEDYEFNYKREVVCDKLNIIRYEAIDEEVAPWLILPILIGDLQVAKIIIWEELGKIDYYDLLAIRIAATLLVEVYEQIYMFHNFEGRFYDEFIKSLISGELDSYMKIKEFSQGIKKIRISLDSNYIVAVIKVKNENFNLYTVRDRIYNSILSNLETEGNIFGILSENMMVIITDINCARRNKESAIKSLKLILSQLNDCFRESEFAMGIGTIVDEVIAIRKSYIEAVKALEVGAFLYKNKSIISFEDLGPFGLLRLENIQDRDFGSNFDKIKPILESVNCEELLETLKVFLECESNYNAASKKLFSHTNTIRYRIAKIQELCDIDLDDPVERLKTEITLKFINLIK